MGQDNNATRVLSAVLGFVPIVGSVKSLAESISGRDIITNSKLTAMDRSLSVVGAIPGFQGVQYIAKSTKYGSKFYKAIETVDKANSYRNLHNSVWN